MLWLWVIGEIGVYGYKGYKGNRGIRDKVIWEFGIKSENYNCFKSRHFSHFN